MASPPTRPPSLKTPPSPEVKERQWKVNERRWKVKERRWKVKERRWKGKERRWKGKERHRVLDHLDPVPVPVRVVVLGTNPPNCHACVKTPCQQRANTTARDCDGIVRPPRLKGACAHTDLEALDFGPSHVDPPLVLALRNTGENALS